MKKNILFLSLLINSLIYSQILEEENFNSYPLGISSGWYVNGYPMPIFTIMQEGATYDKVFKIEIPYHHMPVIITIKKSQNFQSLWNNRQTGNNIFRGEVDIINIGVYESGALGLFDENDNSIVSIRAGSVFVDQPIYGSAKFRRKSDNMIVQRSVLLKEKDAPMPIKVIYTYNSETGEVTFTTPTNTFVLNSDAQYEAIPNQIIKDHKIHLNLANMTAGGMTIDNYKTEAISSANLNVVENNIKTNKAKIFPNPAKDYINIDLKSFQSLEIIDLNGRVIKKLVGYVSKVEISELPTGSYIVKIKKNNNVFIEKLIKI